MIYQVEVKEANNSDFLQIIQSLKNVGVVLSFHGNESIAKEGNSLTENELLLLLKERETDIENGNSLSHDEAIKFMKLWRQINRKSTGPSKHS
jgi:hypothetical protein